MLLSGVDYRSRLVSVSMIARQKSGRSSGLRPETNCRSTITGASFQIAPALTRSSLILSEPVTRTMQRGGQAALTRAPTSTARGAQRHETHLVRISELIAFADGVAAEEFADGHGALAGGLDDLGEDGALSTEDHEGLLVDGDHGARGGTKLAG